MLVQCCRMHQNDNLSSLSDSAASIFIGSPTVKYILPFFNKNIPSSIPSLTIKENLFVSASLKSRCGFFPLYFFFCVPDDERFEKQHGIWMHEQIYLGTCFLKERKTEKRINGRSTTWLLETALFTSIFFRAIFSSGNSVFLFSLLLFKNLLL